MARLAFSRYADFVRYDQAQGALLLLDSVRVPALLTVSGLSAAVAPIAALAALDLQAGTFAAAYGLALAAREWRDRPADARRGAVIQAAEQLCPTNATLANTLLPAALAAADAALFANHDAEGAIVALVDERVRLADRAADRCGRHAAGLIERGDRVLCAGFGGPPLLALLGTLPSDVTARVSLTVADAGDAGAALLGLVTSAAGITVAAAATAATLERDTATICFASALAVATDGGAICAAGTGAVLEAARRQGVPCYLLAPSGPTALAATAHALVAGAGTVDVLAPDLISTFITDRGLYRPAMIARYLSDSEAPLDVIPLLG